MLRNLFCFILLLGLGKSWKYFTPDSTDPKVVKYGEPKYFPDLSCHAEYIKDTKDLFAAINHFWKHSSQCNDPRQLEIWPCYRHCIFTTGMGIFSHSTTDPFCSVRLSEFFNFLQPPQDRGGEGYHMTEVRNLFGCVSRESFPANWGDLPKEQKCRDDIYDCIESVLNCSKSVQPDKIILDLSCHPSYKTDMHDQMLVALNKDCLNTFKDNDICQLVCRTHRPYYHKRPNEIAKSMSTYAVKLRKYSEKDIFNTLAHNLGFKVDFNYVYSKGYQPTEGHIVAKTFVEKCGEIWSQTQSLNWENCAEEQDEWQPLVDCMETVFKCKY